MKRLSVLLCCMLMLSACSHRSKPMQAWTPAKPAPAVEADPFRAGVSSTTVERMAKAAGCVGGKGASLVTPQGPIEMYQMQCDNGSTYKARCDMRQCTAQ